MARIHARKKGKSSSSKPDVVDVSFVTIKAKEIEKLIVQFAKEEDMPASQIGLKLRDTYAVPSVKVVCGKSITQILAENELKKDVPEDLQALVSKVQSLKKHLSSNTRDVHNKRNLILVESKIRRLVKYYKKNNRIPQNWRYD